MNISNRTGKRSTGRLFLLLFWSGLLFSAACAKDPDTPGPDQPDKDRPEQIVEINGTEIAKGQDLVGLITDEQGRGLAGIPVSDGFTFAVTDCNGVYQLKANHYCQKVFCVLPAEYEVPLDQDHRPMFYSPGKIHRGRINRNDFRLRRLDRPMDDFTLVAIGDPQCKTDSDVRRFNSETLPDLRETLQSAQSEGRCPNAYGITLGDITFDNIVQWQPMAESLSNVAIGEGKYLPIFNCIGNHDHNAAEQTDFRATRLYVENFGPTDYALNRGKAHIIVMDNVICTDNRTTTWNYGGGYTEQQMEWLQQDLDLVEDKEDKLVFFVSHIPFRGGSLSDNGANVNLGRHYKDVLDLLTQFKEAHLLIGHTHYTANYIHRDFVCKGGQPIYEHIHGAACGAWWCSNLNVDGSPNGYTLYDIRGGGVYNWVAKGTRLPESCQMRVYNGNDIYNGSRHYLYTWYGGGTGGSSRIVTRGKEKLRNRFIAKIWNSDDTWQVELLVGDRHYPMQRAEWALPDMCAVSFFFNELNKNTTTWNKSLAQYWYCDAPCGDPAEEKDWEVRATQTIPGSGRKNVYRCSTIQSDFRGFAVGSL